jgi:hypothetical protein
MGQLAIVNAPSSFTLIWSIIKPWLSKETAEKVDILGSDYKEQLLKLVDEDCLPSTLGGTCNCKEQGGCHLSGAGPWMDGRVGWGPKANSKEESLSADSGAPHVGASGAGSAGAVGDRKDFVSLSNGSALDRPIEDGHIYELEVHKEAAETRSVASVDSTDFEHGKQDNLQEKDIE